MKRNDVLALAARVEAATGADRELDVLVALAKGWRKESARDWFTPPGVNVRHHKTELPRYTASLDDAMSLVPSGLILRNYQSSRFVPHSCEVALSWAHGGWLGNSDHSFALALTAAALRAIAWSMTDD